VTPGNRTTPKRPFIAGCALACLLLSTAGFTYPEHVWATRRALDLAESLRGEHELQRWTDALEALITNDAFCHAGVQPMSWEADEAPMCFEIADLPALAADHSTSPISLAARWLIDRDFHSDEDPISWVGHRIEEVVDNSNDGTASPHWCNASLPDTQAFLEAVREYDRSSVPRLDTGEIDLPLALADPVYTCLSMRMPAHFRLPGTDLEEAMSMSRPLPNALSEYARYHAEAELLAALSWRAADPVESELLSGLALLHEMYALHFIQDAVAAGHIVTSQQQLSPGSVRATHDYYNENGLIVAVPNEACDLVSDDPVLSAALWRLPKACGSEEKRERREGTAVCVRGDHALFDDAPCVSAAASLWYGGEAEVEGFANVTRDLVVLVSVNSLLEVFDATRAGQYAISRDTAVAMLTDHGRYARLYSRTEREQQLEALRRLSGQYLSALGLGMASCEYDLEAPKEHDGGRDFSVEYREVPELLELAERGRGTPATPIDRVFGPANACASTETIVEAAVHDHGIYSVELLPESARLTRDHTGFTGFAAAGGMLFRFLAPTCRVRGGPDCGDHALSIAAGAIYISPPIASGFRIELGGVGLFPTFEHNVRRQEWSWLGSIGAQGWIGLGWRALHVDLGGIVEVTASGPRMSGVVDLGFDVLTLDRAAFRMSVPLGFQSTLDWDLSILDGPTQFFGVQLLSAWRLR